MVIKEIRVFFVTPLLEFPAAANEALTRGWTSRDSDRDSVAYSQTFDSESAFDSALADLKTALGSRASRIEHGTIHSE